MEKILKLIFALCCVTVISLLLFSSIQKVSVNTYSRPPIRSIFQVSSSRHASSIQATKVPPTTEPDINKGPPKAILVYSNLFGRRNWWDGSEKPNHLKNIGCKYHNCYITYDNSKLKDASAVVFHSRDMPPVNELRIVSREKRPLDQYWGYFSAECPLNNPNTEPLNGLFNLTMTYKIDSDIFLPYRKFIRTDHPKPNNINYALNKPKMAYWLVSNCGVRVREDVVRLLEKHGVQVDVGGGCRGRWPHRLQCSGRTCRGLSEYKFYLAFENSYCKDYVTSKYFVNGIDCNAIPIVLGGNNYSDPRLAIPGSFINVQDFPSVNKLAKYMLRVAGDDRLFNSFFKWREHYDPVVVKAGYVWPFVGKMGWPCDLCRIVHTRKPAHKVYDKLSDYWSAKNDCYGRDEKIKQILRNSF